MNLDLSEILPEATQAEQDALYARAQERLDKMRSDTVDRALLLGMSHAHKVIEDPKMQENMARQALMHELMAAQPEAGIFVPGPARRKPPRTNSRKAQRQARKRSR